mmetsp:Transcript_109731/g.211088  ORF Transcript_109731/g.211088 Transcript_109731/m.211088 type:complete len:91 (+) Transcript_109731:2310-2582(+)
MGCKTSSLKGFTPAGPPANRNGVFDVLRVDTGAWRREAPARIDTIASAGTPSTRSTSTSMVTRLDLGLLVRAHTTDTARPFNLGSGATPL